MEWWRTHGDKAEWHAARDTPTWRERPRLHPGIEPVSRCFSDLDAARGMDGGIRPGDVDSWCRMHGIRSRRRIARYWRWVHAIDVNLLLDVRQKRDADSLRRNQR